MAETLGPSVRRSQTLPLGAVLLLTGLTANLPVVAVSWVLGGNASFGSRLLPSAIGIAAALIDFLRLRFPHLPRPLAVHRQVPQWYGHRHGPWRAAVRYGFRLGFGPATILNSWTWWAGTVIAVLRGPGFCLALLSVFVVVRTLTMLAVGHPGVSGTAMARRSAWVQRTERTSVVLGSGIALAASLGVAAFAVT